MSAQTSTSFGTLPSSGILWTVTFAVLIASSYVFLRRGKVSITCPYANVQARSDHILAVQSGSSSHSTTKAVSTDPSEQPGANMLKGPFQMGEVRVSKLFVHPIKASARLL